MRGMLSYRRLVLIKLIVSLHLPGSFLYAVGMHRSGLLLPGWQDGTAALVLICNSNTKPDSAFFWLESVVTRGEAQEWMLIMDRDGRKL
jgi:hypothetical protein